MYIRKERVVLTLKRASCEREKVLFFSRFHVSYIFPESTRQPFTVC